MQQQQNAFRRSQALSWADWDAWEPTLQNQPEEGGYIVHVAHVIGAKSPHRPLPFPSPLQNSLPRLISLLPLCQPLSLYVLQNSYSMVSKSWPFPQGLLLLGLQQPPIQPPCFLTAFSPSNPSYYSKLVSFQKHESDHDIPRDYTHPSYDLQKVLSHKNIIQEA